MTTTATVEISPCTVADMANHAREMFREHWEEVAKLKHLMVLSPNWDRYGQLAVAGVLLAIAAWEGPRMVGYSANVITNHLHYRDLVVCQNDVLFVAQSHRKSSVGLRLMRETERLAAERGAKLVLWHAKPETTLDRMLGREGSGYSVQDIIYAKEL